MNFIKTTLLAFIATAAVAQTAQAASKRAIEEYAQKHAVLISLFFIDEPSASHLNISQDEAIAELKQNMQEALADSSKQVIFINAGVGCPCCLPADAASSLKVTPYIKEIVTIIKATNEIKPVVMMVGLPGTLSSEVTKAITESTSAIFTNDIMQEEYGNTDVDAALIFAYAFKKCGIIIPDFNDDNSSAMGDDNCRS